jgi:hypothetical protein
MVSSDLSMQDVEASIAATIAPLKAQLSLVEGKERLILDELTSIREMKARLLSTLRKLDPDMPGPGKPKKKQTGRGTHIRNGGVAAEQVLATVREAVDKVAPNNPDGFTRSRVTEQLKEDGIAMGDARQKEAIEELHASGYLTLHKLVTGGNKSYKRTEDLDDSARHAV